MINDSELTRFNQELNSLRDSERETEEERRRTEANKK